MAREIRAGGGASPAGGDGGAGGALCGSGSDPAAALINPITRRLETLESEVAELAHELHRSAVALASLQETVARLPALLSSPGGRVR